MAIYIEISGKSYKLPNKITIGRGEPFKQFNQNRKVARTHFSLILSKGVVYIKDLGTSKEGMFVNGKKIKSKTNIKLSANDEIVFADERIQLLADCPLEYIEIKKSAVGNLNGFDYFKILSFSPFIFFAWYMVSSLTENKFDFMRAFASLLFSTFLSYLFHVYFKFLKRIGVDVLKEVIFSHEGFTTYTTDNLNMTFSLDKIDSWTIEREKVLNILAHGQTFEYYLDGSFEEFKRYLNEKLSFKRAKIENLRNKRGVFFLLFVIGLELISDFSNPTLQYFGVSVLSFWVIASVSMLFKKEFRKFWIVQVGKRSTSLFQTGSLVFSALYGLFLINSTLADMNKHQSNLTAAASCSKQNKESCLKIDYWHTYTTDVEYKNQKVACDVGNKKACSYRSPASIKE